MKNLQKVKISINISICVIGGTYSFSQLKDGMFGEWLDV